MLRSNSVLARTLCELNRPVRLDDLPALAGSSIPGLQRFHEIGCQLVAPFHGRECLRGVLFLSGKLNGHPFSDSDIRFLGLLILQFSVAIDNAVLYESERKYAEDLIGARERLAQSERMAALGRLSVAIAHEINNPLGIIHNYLHIAEQNVAPEGPARDALDTVASEVERIARIVRQLLDAFRPESMRPSAVDPGEIVVGVVKFVEPEMTQLGITIECRGLEELPYVSGRADSLKQVFINLLLNARDAMPRGGKVTIAAHPTATSVVIEICDEGRGLDERDQDHLFDAFYSTKEAGRGTGLGLFISRNIVEGFGGSIKAANCEPPRRGAVFCITLPRVDVPKPAKTTASAGRTGSAV
jgi:signal transduction histidine kinase